ncbi:hypothetical protein I5S84_01375 [Pseudomonas putida]|uniref:hypothetical protein n=1 Tax=Pseudomonas putida TaxID=303 RepID=UPI0018D78259|nr:hypothetical protein [Pseudomonas putida]MBH3447492.1 hypothetical protein [Pseudomonas putida]
MRIALVLLFLTATQFAQADTLLKTKEGCAIVLNEGEDFDGASWSGKCKNGKIDGVGRLQMKSRGSSDYDTDEWAEYKDGRWAFPEVSLNAIGAAINNCQLAHFLIWKSVKAIPNAGSSYRLHSKEG